ncbi:MAG: transporter [Betaproteobacteria bacterium]
MKWILLPVFVTLFAAGPTFAAHPLITDDTGTQGKGKYQFEFIGEYGHDKDDGVTTGSLAVPTVPVLSYGVADTTDLVLGIPYQRIETTQDSITNTESGISDASIELKWRFYEKEGLSFAVKPGITLPTGDENKGLGNGRTSYKLFFISTKDVSPWAFHLNLGYIRNEYKLQADEEANRKDIWHASLASEVKVIKDLKAVANIGMERNPDKTSDTDPAFILGGLIYSITENLDVDFGVKGGLNKPETDISYLAGITWRL